MMKAFDVVEVHKSLVGVGDIVVCEDGKERTVCAKDIDRDDLFGITIFGDSYVLGRKPVKILKYNNPMKRRN